MSEHFQTVVIGNSLAGLLAAIKLQLAGHRVLLIADTADPSGEVLKGYWCSDEDQFIPVPGCQEFKQVLKGLGLLELPADKDLWQILLPGCRLDLKAEMVANKEELKRYFPDADPILNGYGGYPDLAGKIRTVLFGGEKTLFPQGAWDKFKRGFRKKELSALPPLPSSDNLPETWRSLERYYLGSRAALALSALGQYPREEALVLADFWQQHYLLPDAVADFSHLLQKHFVELGGQFKKGAVTAINVKSGKVTSVVLGPQGEFTCESAVLAGHKGQARLISKAGAQKKLAVQEAQRKTDEAMWVVHFLLKSEVRPLGMADRCLGLVSDEISALVSPWLEISLTNPIKNTVGAKATVEKRVDDFLVCTVKCLVKPSLLAQEEARHHFLTLIQQYLKEIIPFFTDFLIDTTPSSAEPRFYSKLEPRLDGKLDPAGLPINTPFANCWHCRDWCLPGMGQEGSWQCANIVVSRALQYFRR